MLSINQLKNHTVFRDLLVSLSLFTCCLCFGVNSSAQEATETKIDKMQLMEAMSLTSNAFRSAVEKIRPSLVTIESFGGVSAVQGRIGGIRKQGEGNTTGILISKEGHIVTSSFNFITSPPVITVITSDGERRVAKLLGRDETRKICLLKLNPFPGIQLPEIAPLNEITVGQWAISVGVGYGDANPAVSTGIISAKNRIGGRAIQTDANTSPANYGGPLLDIEGRVTGICVPLNPQNQAVGAGVEWYDSGIGFAIPLDGAAELIERLKTGERIYPGRLGIRMEANPDGSGGIRVVEVVPKSAASEAGLGHGDIIRKLNDKEVADQMELRKIMFQLEAGDEVTIVFDSHLEEKSMSATVKLGKPPAPKDDAPPMEPPKIR